MVVTEMATPTAAPAAVSKASIPAIPAVKATRTVPGPISVSEGPSTVSARSSPLSTRSKTRSSAVAPAAVREAMPSPTHSVTAAARGERQPPLDEPDGNGRDREEVRTEGHRSDDEDR